MRIALVALLCTILGCCALADTIYPLPSAVEIMLGRPRVTGIAASPTTNALGIATTHGVELRVLESLALMSVVPDSEDAIRIAFSSDGLQMAILTNHSSEELRIWDISDSSWETVLDAEVMASAQLVFSPDGRYLACVDAGGLAVWSTDGWASVAVPTVAANETRAIAFSSDGKWLALGTANGAVVLLEVGSAGFTVVGEVIASETRVGTSIASLEYHPGGSQLALGTEAGDIELWNAESWEQVATMSGYGRFVNQLLYSEDGTRLYSGSRAMGVISVWSVSTGELEEELSDTYRETLLDLVLSADGSTLVAATQEGTVAQWSEQDLQPIYCKLTFAKSFSSSVTSVAFSPDGSMLAVGFEDLPRLWTTATWERASSSMAQGVPPIPHISVFSPDSRYLLTAMSMLVALMDTKNGASLGTSMPHSSSIQDIEVSPTGTTFATAGADRTVKITDFENGLPLHTLDMESVPNCLSYSADGRWLAVGLQNGTVQIRNTEDYQVLAERAAHTYPVTALQFSPDNRLLVSCSSASAVHVWATDTWTIVNAFMLHGGTIEGLSFSSDGVYLALGNTIMNVEWWTTIAELGGQYGRITASAFAPDGHYFVTGSNDGTALVWDFEAILAQSDALLIDILVSSTEVRVGETVRLSLYCEDGGEAPMTISWRIDGSEISTEQTVTHVFHSPGTYRVTVRAEDSQGHMGSSHSLIVVSEEP